MVPPTIVNLQGPLPLKATFQTESSGPATLFVSGSVWTQSQDNLIGVSVSYDGGAIGDVSIWSNGPHTHRAVVPRYFVIDLDQQPSGGTPPTYTVMLEPMNAETVGDVNDSYQVVLFT